MAIRSFADDAREHVTIELWLNETPLGHILLEPSDAEQFLHEVAKHRATLSEKVTPMLDPGARLEAVVEPKWQVARQKDGSHGLAIRHPGFGWLSFALSDDQAKALAKALTEK